MVQQLHNPLRFGVVHTQWFVCFSLPVFVLVKTTCFLHWS